MMSNARTALKASGQFVAFLACTWCMLAFFTRFVYGQWYSLFFCLSTATHRL